MEEKVMTSDYLIKHEITTKSPNNEIIECNAMVLVKKELFADMVDRIDRLTEGLKDVMGELVDVSYKPVSIRQLPECLEAIYSKGQNILLDPTLAKEKDK